jgi:hypothetical protein
VRSSAVDATLDDHAVAGSDHGTTPEITLTDRLQHGMRLMRVLRWIAGRSARELHLTFGLASHGRPAWIVDGFYRWMAVADEFLATRRARIAFTAVLVTVAPVARDYLVSRRSLAMLHEQSARCGR